MYIVQLADLHVGSKEKSSREEKDIIEKSIQVIKNIVPKGEEILICVCGDIIDSKGLDSPAPEIVKSRYETAAGYLKIYASKLCDYLVKFKFCVGNHDIFYLDEFVEYMSEFDGELTKKECLLNGYMYFHESDNTYFLFRNSCVGGQYKIGKLDLEALKAVLQSLPIGANKILVLHHTIMSMDEKDSSSIRNAAGLLGLIEDYNISGVLHGHTHGQNILTLGRKKLQSDRNRRSV